jgi:FkbM family methyltransferase
VGRYFQRFSENVLPSSWQLPVNFAWHWLHGQVEKELWVLRRWADHKRIAVDIGANQGFYSMHLARWFRRVEAFEPNPTVVEILRAYGSRKVHINQVALSSAEGEATLRVPVSAVGVEHSSWGSLENRIVPGAAKMREIRVPLRTLDSFGLTDVGLIKMDVEGHEQAVLEGAQQTLQHCRPIVMMEVKPSSRAMVKRQFDGLDYNLFTLEGGSLNPVGNAFESLPEIQENVFALPRNMTATR